MLYRCSNIKRRLIDTDCRASSPEIHPLPFHQIGNRIPVQAALTANEAPAHVLPVAILGVRPT
ncbi:hypothetical protein [Desulfatirhabdium butyrativorans]|uniref:hypothetical protein n=1 Tax=Desulfatirhabdium butyrativorans TaxID=340467 RepID=UPI000406BA57|nr:hypothetical protein [Desulfatirhabdium butyrativorans]